MLSYFEQARSWTSIALLFYKPSRLFRADGRLVNISEFFRTNNAQAPPLFSNRTAKNTQRKRASLSSTGRCCFWWTACTYTHFPRKNSPPASQVCSGSHRKYHFSNPFTREIIFESGSTARARDSVQNWCSPSLPIRSDQGRNGSPVGEIRRRRGRGRYSRTFARWDRFAAHISFEQQILQVWRGCLQTKERCCHGEPLGASFRNFIPGQTRDGNAWDRRKKTRYVRSLCGRLFGGMDTWVCTPTRVHHPLQQPTPKHPECTAGGDPVNYMDLKSSINSDNKLTHEFFRSHRTVGWV